MFSVCSFCLFTLAAYVAHYWIILLYYDFTSLCINVYCVRTSETHCFLIRACSNIDSIIAAVMYLALIVYARIRHLSTRAIMPKMLTCAHIVVLGACQ